MTHDRSYDACWYHLSNESDKEVYVIGLIWHREHKCILNDITDLYNETIFGRTAIYNETNKGQPRALLNIVCALLVLPFTDSEILSPTKMSEDIDCQLWQ